MNDEAVRGSGTKMKWPICPSMKFRGVPSVTSSAVYMLSEALRVVRVVRYYAVLRLQVSVNRTSI